MFTRESDTNHNGEALGFINPRLLSFISVNVSLQLHVYLTTTVSKHNYKTKDAEVKVGGISTNGTEICTIEAWSLSLRNVTSCAWDYAPVGLSILDFVEEASHPYHLGLQKY